MDSWWNFFYLCGSAAATLTGLMFIAVPLGSALIRKENLAEVNVFLSPLCFHFLHVFFLCCMTAVPRANPWLTGIAAIVSAALRLATLPKNYSVLRALSRKEESDIDRSDWVILMVLPTTIYLSFIAAGIGFLSGKPWAVPMVSLRSSLQLTHDVIKVAPFNRSVHHHNFWLQQPTAVWSLLLQGDSEGPTFIFRTARHYAAPS